MSLTQTKDKLTESISIHDRLAQEIENNAFISSLNDTEWTEYLRTLGHDTAKLIQASRLLDNESLIDALKKKQKRLEKHKIWKKGSKKKNRNRLILTERKNKKWIKEVEWKVTTTPTRHSQENAENKQEKETKLRIKDLTKKLDRLVRLRNLRRKKLESRGHFFAEDGNDFFNKIKEWNEQQQQEAEKNSEPVVKKLVVDKQDVWKSMELDQGAYGFWCESNQSLDALLRIRKQWDKYLFHGELDQRDPTGKIPPNFVTPSPPANWVWATCLL